MKKLQLALNIVLIAITLFLGYKWLYQMDGASEERIKQLEKELDQLIKKKEENEKSILFWKNQFDSLSVEDAKIKDKIIILEKDIISAENEANSSKKKLEKLKAELAAIRKKIDDFKKNPPNREDDELLKSLKNKLK